MTPPDNLNVDIGSIRKSWGWFLALGIILILVGAAALGRPFIFGLVTIKVIGFLLIFSGATEIVFAIQMRGWGGVALNILSGVLEIIVGALILKNPVTALEMMTLLFSAYFLVGGIFRIVAALTLRVQGAGWLALSGLVTAVLGGMLWAEWPETSEWLLGTLVGIDLVVHGVTWIALAFTLRSGPPVTTANS